MVTSESIFIFHEVYHLSTFFIPMVGLVEKLDQFRVSGKLPTDPYPNPTFCAKWEVSVNVDLGEG